MIENTISQSPEQIALAYVEAINDANVERLYGMITNDHLFIDAHDNRVLGKDQMKKGWTGYFAMFPDYKIEVNEVLVKGSSVCLLGYAGGTYKSLKNKENSNYWRVPAAWNAIIENGYIKQWQVYADNVFPIQIINRNEATPYPIKKLE